MFKNRGRPHNVQEVINMITTTCLSCKQLLTLRNYRLVQFDKIIIVREYFGRCYCGHIVHDEDFRDEDQVYLDMPELLDYTTPDAP